MAVTDIIDDVSKTAEEIKKTGKKSIAVKGDITKKTMSPQLVKKVVDEYKKIDILWNVAGGSPTGHPMIRPSRKTGIKIFVLTSTVLCSPARLRSPI